MKAITFVLLTSFTGGIAALAQRPIPAVDIPVVPESDAANEPSTSATELAEPATASRPDADTDKLRMNFVDAPLDTVLNYLSSAAGFIILKEVQPLGKVSVVSMQPMTKNEAVSLLDSVLYQHGCGVIRGGINGRILSIVRQDQLQTRGIPVHLWDGDPESIPRADVMVTMILPVRFVAVTELVRNILPLVSPNTPLTANLSGNSIIITDTQANIRRIAEVVDAVDKGAEDVTVVTVFDLEYANPSEIADEILTLFSDDSRNNTLAPVIFGTGNNRGSGTGENTRARTRSHVVAVPDMRTGSVIVAASRDAIDDISKTVNALDRGAGEARNPKLAFFSCQNADPAEVMQVLQDIFNRNGTQSRSTTLTSPLLSRASSYGTGSSSRTRAGSFGANNPATSSGSANPGATTGIGTSRTSGF
jgi:general secretion pathway protein D